MLSHVASSVIESAKSQVEWMSEKILRIFEAGRHNPFQFRFVKFCHSLIDLNRVRSPKVRRVEFFQEILMNLILSVLHFAFIKLRID